MTNTHILGTHKASPLQYRERIIFLGQAVDEELGNQLVGTILYLDSENNKDMRLYINTFGGDVSPPPPPPPHHSPPIWIKM